MKLIAVSLVFCAGALCQNAPSNAVNGDALKNRMEAMKLLDGIGALRNQPRATITRRSEVCAIPPLNALRPNDQKEYKLRVVKPAPTESAATIVPAMPPCK